MRLLVDLSANTGMKPSDWLDFLTATPDQQALMAKGYADLDWVAQHSTFTTVLNILTIMGTIAGVVTGVAGAAQSLAALKNL